MLNQIEKCYFDRNPEGLLALGVSGHVVDKWRLHWTGRVVDARNTVVSEALSGDVAALVAADQWLLDVKLGQQSSPCILSTGAGTGARFIKTYADWYHYFWKNQKGAWRALFTMLWLSCCMSDFRAWVMTIFLLGHLMVIRGHKTAGFFLAKKMAQRACSLLNSKGKSVRFFYDVVAVFPFTAFVAKKNPRDHEALMEHIGSNLPCDPYYRSLYYLAKLYEASYGGDILGTEIFSQKLLREQDLGQLQRYRIVVEVMELLPLALRGYGHVVEDKMRALLDRIKTCQDAAVYAAYFRACAVVSLYQGEMKQAVSLISKSRTVGKSTGLALAWREVDEDIEAYATGAKPFNPLHNVFVTGQREIPYLPKFGAIMVRLIQITGSAAQKDDCWFVHRVAELLQEHLSCTEAEVVKLGQDSDPRPSGNIIISGYKITFLPASPEEGSYLRMQLSSVSPLLSCLAALRADQKRAFLLSNASTATAVARQVAHDIRSPLAALSMIGSELGELPEETRLLLRMSIDRVEQIANDLLDKSRDGMTSQPKVATIKPTTFPVSILLQEVLAEKRLSTRNSSGITLDGPSQSDLYNVFVNTDIASLRRVLANLVNNAVEALDQGGRIIVDATATLEHVQLYVRDNGCGIQPERLKSIFDAGVTFGKKNGNGLGLSHAKASIEAAGGTVSVESESGVGTTFTVELPRADPPAWFAPHLDVGEEVIIAVIDDDPPIHQIWLNRLASEPTLKGRRSDCKHFYNAEEFLQWWGGAVDRSRVLIVTDHEFRGGTETGLSLVKKLNAAKRAILVTSHHEDRDVQIACAQIGLRILPKAMAASIPLRGHGCSN